ncbi:hypothetical protein GM524_13600, partial [Streptococcus pneumoniae]|nr:hypothetical protein [Streptococcus pneumoniae]
MRRTPEETITLVRQLGEMDPQRIAERLQVTPSAIYKAACIVGDAD